MMRLDLVDKAIGCALLLGLAVAGIVTWADYFRAVRVMNKGKGRRKQL